MTMTAAHGSTAPRREGKLLGLRTHHPSKYRTVAPRYATRGDCIKNLCVIAEAAGEPEFIDIEDALMSLVL